MEIIVTIKPMLKFMGLLFNYSDKFYYKIYGAFWFMAVFLFIIPEMIYFYKNINDVIKASDVIIFMAAKSMTVIKLLFFYYYKMKYSQLVNRLQHNIYYKKEQNRLKHYVQAEIDCKLFTNIYYTLFIAGINLGFGLPLVVVFYNYIIGKLTTDIWYLPYPVVLFYDTDKTPGFQITYAIIGIALIGLVCNFCAIDSLFVGMCIHLKAGYRDLQDMIIELNDCHEADDDSKQLESLVTTTDLLLHHSSQQWDQQKMMIATFKKDLKNCIIYQEFLMDCFNRLQEVNSGIIFTQFAGTILIMCASIFQMTTSFQSGKILSYINLWACYLSQLFVYALYGNMLSSELTKVSTTIYMSLWYRRPPILRRQCSLMILNGQVQRHLRGFNYLNCSMENLSAVLRASLSAVALLRSVKEKF